MTPGPTTIPYSSTGVIGVERPPSLVVATAPVAVKLPVSLPPTVLTAATGPESILLRQASQREPFVHFLRDLFEKALGFHSADAMQRPDAEGRLQGLHVAGRGIERQADFSRDAYAVSTKKLIFDPDVSLPEIVQEPKLRNQKMQDFFLDFTYFVWAWPDNGGSQVINHKQEELGVQLREGLGWAWARQCRRGLAMFLLHHIPV